LRHSLRDGNFDACAEPEKSDDVPCRSDEIVDAVSDGFLTTMTDLRSRFARKI
jgi:hypothetical protein